MIVQWKINLGKIIFLALILAMLQVSFAMAGSMQGHHLKVVSIIAERTMVSSGEENVPLTITIYNHNPNPVRLENVSFVCERGSLEAQPAESGIVVLEAYKEKTIQYCINIPQNYLDGLINIDAIASGIDIVTHETINNNYNMIFNGDMSLDSNSNGIPDGWDNEVVGIARRDTEYYVSPPASLKLTGASNITTYAWNKVPNLISVDETYLLELYLKYDIIGWAQIVVYWYSSTGFIKQINAIAFNGKSEEWSKRTATLNPPQGASHFTISVFFSKGVTGDVWADDVKCMTKAKTNQKLQLNVQAPPMILGLDIQLDMQDIKYLVEDVQNPITLRYIITNPTENIIKTVQLQDMFPSYIDALPQEGVLFDSQTRKLIIDFGSIEPQGCRTKDITLLIKPDVSLRGRSVDISTGAFITGYSYPSNGEEVIYCRTFAEQLSTEVLGKDKGLVVKKQVFNMLAEVYSLDGSLIKKLYYGEQIGNNKYCLQWDGKNENNRRVGKGRYVVKLTTVGGLGKIVDINVSEGSNKVSIEYSLIVDYDSYGREEVKQLFNYVGTENGTLISDFAISPNPFNVSTQQLEISHCDDSILLMKATIMDLNGNVVCYLDSGVDNVLWNGRDKEGRLVSPGVYIAFVETHDIFGKSRKHRFLIGVSR